MASEHEVAVYEVLKRGDWVTSRRVASEAGIAASTARHHLLRFVRQGIAESTALYPGRRYRLTQRSAPLEAVLPIANADRSFRSLDRPAESIRDLWSRRG